MIGQLCKCSGGELRKKEVYKMGRWVRSLSFFYHGPFLFEKFHGPRPAFVPFGVEKTQADRARGSNVIDELEGAVVAALHCTRACLPLGHSIRLVGLVDWWWVRVQVPSLSARLLPAPGAPPPTCRSIMLQTEVGQWVAGVGVRACRAPAAPPLPLSQSVSQCHQRGERIGQVGNPIL